MPSPIRDIANCYRVERVAFDVASADYDANEDEAAEPTLRAALNEAFDRCQALAKALVQLPGLTIEERGDKMAVAFDAAILAGKPSSTLLNIVEKGNT